MGKRFQDEETDMRCVICKAGDTAPGTVTVTLQRGNTVVVIRDVPAAVCRNCGKKEHKQGEQEEAEGGFHGSNSRDGRLCL
jgi:YgiT-type zinc finger domain-containing protein